MIGPKVSIVIPVYNGANYLSKAIDSALAQTYQNIEIIVVNDGSNDDGATEEIALGYGDKIRYFKKENGGVSTALNLGIKMMEGEYFSWLSHDDLYTEDKIEKQVALIENENDIIHCSTLLIDKDGKELTYPIKVVEGVLDGVHFLKKYVEDGYQLNGLGFLIPKAVFEDVSTFDEKLVYSQDRLLWFFVMHGGYRFICQKEKLTKSRVHQLQVSNKYPELYYKEMDIVAKKLESEFKEKNFDNNIDFAKLYLCYFQKVDNQTGIDIFTQILKVANEYKLGIKIKRLVFLYKGKVKALLKKGYCFLLRVKGCRG